MPLHQAAAFPVRAAGPGALRPDGPARTRLSGREPSAELVGAGEKAAAAIRGVFERIEATLPAVAEEGLRTSEIDAGRDPQEIASGLPATIAGMHVPARTADGPERLTRVVAAAVVAL